MTEKDLHKNQLKKENKRLNKENVQLVEENVQLVEANVQLDNENTDLNQEVEQLNEENYRLSKANNKNKRIKILSIILSIVVVLGVVIFSIVFLGVKNSNNSNANLEELKSDALILSVEGGAIEGLETTLRVSEDVDSVALLEKVTVSEGASWQLYQDVECKEKIFSGNLLDLQIGTNVYYIAVQSEDGKTNTLYKLNVIKSNEFLLTLTQNLNRAGTVSGAGNKCCNSEITIEATSNPGYTFLGWYDGITVVSTSPSYTFVMPTFNKTLEARWKVNTYTVTIKSSNIEYGTVNKDSVLEVPYGTVLAIRDNVVTVNGVLVTANKKPNTAQYTYKFAGWTNGTKEVKEDLTVTAKFTQTVNQYTYTFYAENGSTIVKSKKVDYGSQIVEPVPPAKTKTQEFTYTFAGWDKEVPATITKDITFKATYTSAIRQYTVTFTDYNGTTLKAQNVDYGLAATAPNEPSRAGYTFADWDKAYANVKSDITVVARYTANKYTITFESNGGSEVGNITEDYEKTVAKPENPTKSGYIFGGWYSDSSLADNYEYALSTMPLNGIKLYAKWNLDTYTISYTLNGGAVDVSTPNLDSYSIETDTFTLNNPAREGYIFTGWSGTKLTGEANKSVQITKGETGNRNYTAHWTAEQYTISFNTASGDAKDSVNVTYDATYDLGEATRTGYDFKGWYDNATLVATAGNAWNIASDVTLVASWKAKTYQVSFITAGGNVKEPVYVTYDAAYDLGEATRTGYDFKGWYENSTPVATTGSAWNIANDINLTATWEAIKYEIIYILQDNETSVASHSNPVEYTIESTIVLSNANRNGYDFEGWTTTGVTTPTTGLTIPKNSTGKKTFTANWKTVDYDINYLDVEAGENAATNPVKYNIESLEITLADPSREGSTFKGWTTTEITTPTKALKILTGSTGIKTFTAHWEIKKYTVTINVNETTYGSVNHTSVEVNHGTTLSYIDNVLTVGSTTVTATPQTDDTGEWDYTFVDWTNGTAKITGTGVIVTANFEATKNQYDVSFAVNNASYGSVSPPETLNVDYGTTISVVGNKITVGNTEVTANPKTDSTGEWEYTFENWTKGGVVITEPTTVTGITAIQANFKATKNKYDVSFAVNNDSYGSVSPLETLNVAYGTSITVNGNKITVGTTTVEATPKTESNEYTYAFANWTKGGVVITEPTTVTGITAIQANFTSTPREYTITLNSNPAAGGTLTGAGTYTYNILVTLTATANEGYEFDGWYENDIKIDEAGTNWEFNILASKTYTVKWNVKPLYTRINGDGTLNPEGDHILFGEFPQTKELNLENIDTSSTIPMPSGSVYNEYYLGTDGKTKYVKVSDSYYKVEPIKWKILDADFKNTGKALIVCDNGIIGKRYNFNGNKYRDSEIRTWLKNQFYNTAFITLQQQIIQETSVDNSAASTDNSNNPYATENTNDKVFLLSYQEVFNNSAYFSEPVARIKKATDYAKATGASTNTNGSCYWWLRSPKHDNEQYACGVHQNSGSSSFSVGSPSRCVVPALVIDLS